MSSPTPGAVIAQTLKMPAEINGLLQKLFGPAFEEAGGIYGDKIRVYRMERQIELLEKTKKILNDHNLTPKAVNLKVLLPLMEAATLEDNSDMQARWAALLASAADDADDDSLHNTFVEIMKQLTPTDAFIIDAFYRQIER